MFALPESFWQDLEKGYYKRPIISGRTGKPYVFSLPKLIETLDIFVENELAGLDEEVYEAFEYKTTVLEYKGYSKNTVRGVFKPGKPNRELVDLLCLYAHSKIYPECVSDGLLPNAVPEYAKLKSSIKGRHVRWSEGLLSPKTNLSEDENIMERLLSIVRNANNAEFEAYSNLPSIDTTELEKYLWVEGTAFRRIFNVLDVHRRKAWVINNPLNPSGHEELGIWIERLTGDQAIIKTEEYWYLRWYGANTQRYEHIYNEKNTQTWSLVKRDGQWKVMHTHYPPPKWKMKNFLQSVWRKLLGK